MKGKIKEKAKLIYKKVIFSLSANSSLLYTSYYKYFYKAKPGSLADFIDQFSQKYPQLSVVQVGANDGLTHDPIHKFIKRDKWQGVLLEPQPFVFEKYLKKLHRHTNGIHTLNAALDYKNGSRPLYKIAHSEARWATGLSSFDRAALQKAVDSGRVANKLKEEGKTVPARQEDLIEEIPVPCITPATLLEKYKIKKLDFLQIDTEGYDYEIIKMFDIPTTKPRVIVYENHNLSKEDKLECADFLRSEGYWVKESSGDTIAMHQPDQEFQSFFKETRSGEAERAKRIKC